MTRWYESGLHLRFGSAELMDKQSQIARIDLKIESQGRQAWDIGYRKGTELYYNAKLRSKETNLHVLSDISQPLCKIQDQ